VETIGTSNCRRRMLLPEHFPVPSEEPKNYGDRILKEVAQQRRMQSKAEMAPLELAIWDRDSEDIYGEIVRGLSELQLDRSEDWRELTFHLLSGIIGMSKPRARYDKWTDTLLDGFDSEHSDTSDSSDKNENPLISASYKDITSASSSSSNEEPSAPWTPSTSGPTLDPLKQLLVDRLMEEFWTIFNDEWAVTYGHVASSDSSSAATCSGSEVYSRTSNTFTTDTGRKRLLHSQGEEDGHGDDSDRPLVRKKPRLVDHGTDRPRFACPFRKRNPEKYSAGIRDWQVCALIPHDSSARVKYVTQMAFYSLKLT
jgi:hypothetical protein